MLPPNLNTWAETASVLAKPHFEAATIHYNSSILLSVVSNLFNLILQTYLWFGFFLFLSRYNQAECGLLNDYQRVFFKTLVCQYFF